jgi:hypothetical protein
LLNANQKVQKASFGGYDLATKSPSWGLHHFFSFNYERQFLQQLEAI